ncbi:MAG TPA: 7TM diverse intracellular signaling domain-containing protein [Bacillus sp. (in: firmicutes)]|nr:7TM diverse intracellular signaling domain-containing protein [Bacillus sp. (in: firmicutes)]
MQRKLAIIASVILCAFTVVGFIRGSSSHLSAQSIVEKGELHLTSTKELVDLNGEWRFYHGELIDPLNIDKTARKSILINVPQRWDSLFPNKNGQIKAGTYRMTLTVPKDGVYGFKADSIRHSSKVFVNGVEAGGIGNPSEKSEEFEFREGPFLFFGESKNKQLDIVIHAANRNSNNGGIVKPILFGAAEEILLESAKSKQLDGFITGGYLILGLLFLFQFIQQKREKNELFFAFFCFVQSFYISTQNEKLIYLLFPEIPSDLLLSLQLGLIHLSVLFFLLFIHNTFRQQSVPRVTNWLVVLLIVKIIYISFSSLLFWVISVIPAVIIQVSLIALLGSVYIYIFYILMKAYRQKVSGCEYILVATMSFSCYGVALGVELLLQIDIGRIPLFLFLIMTISFSFYIGFLRQLAHIRIDNLSKELLVQDQLKNEFLIKTSNKIKGPLHLLMRLTNKLMEGEEGPLKQKQQEFVLEMQNSGKKIDRLVKDLLHAGSGNKLSLKILPVPLEFISEMVDELREVLTLPADVKLVDHIPQNLPCVLADKEKLKEVIFNVLDNALRYTPTGEIRLSAKRLKKYVQISISDTGKGFDELYVNKVFDTFFPDSRWFLS